MPKKLLVIGGGAAGFFCAVNAARLNPSLEVVLIEKTGKLLSKVKVSGGGRCNVTHACFEIVELSKRYPRGGNFVKKAFHQFFTKDTIEWYGDRGVRLKTEEDGRMFPVTDSSQTIIDCLLRESEKHRVQIMMNGTVEAITRREDGFHLQLNGNRSLQADYVCVAAGGYPKSSMFAWLSEFQHSIVEPVPSLFTFNIPGHSITKLMGITVEEAIVRISGTKLMQQGPVLITHWGLSGPAVLRTSAWGARELAALNWNFPVTINWLTAYNEQTLREAFMEKRHQLAAQKIQNRNPFGLPGRLWEYFLLEAGVKTDTRWADLPAREQNKLIRSLVSSEFSVKGKTTFKEEFVTAGGISLSEVDPNTMMSRKVPGLFFAGEILDVDGVTGGFNFQHAWTSGFIAATHIAELSGKVN